MKLSSARSNGLTYHFLFKKPYDAIYETDEQNNVALVVWVRNLASHKFFTRELVSSHFLFATSVFTF